MKKILVFTGAGVSAESGIKTFRDHDGLWNSYRIEEVATPQAWMRNPKLVLDFYNMRRQELKSVKPNEAHLLIAALENKYEVCVVTQNVDNLHERAGSSNVIHLHGELNKVRSIHDPELVYEWTNDLSLGDHCALGHQLRPHIVWFGEVLDERTIRAAKVAAESSDYCIIIGTSMQVYPACDIPYMTRPNCKIYFIDPQADQIHLAHQQSHIHRIPNKASEGMKMLYSVLMD